MINFLIIALFISEIIIFLFTLTSILRLIKSVNKLNKLLIYEKTNIKSYFIDIRFALRVAQIKVKKLKRHIAKKREEYMIASLKNIAAYSGILLLNGKYRKIILAYQMSKEIYEGMKES